MEKKGKRSLLKNIWFLTLPSCVWISAFLVLPAVFIIVMSFWEFTGFSAVPAFTLVNYKAISIVDLKIFLKTLEYSVIVVFLTLVFGYPAVYYLAFHVRKTSTKIALFIVCMIPFWTSYLTRMMAWFPMLARETGVINLTLTGVGIVDKPIQWLIFSDFATIVVMLQLNILMMMGPIFFMLSKIDRSIIDAAKDLGAPFWRVFKEIIFPLSLPGVAIGSIFVFVLIMGEFATPAFIGGGKTFTVGAQIRNDLININLPAASVKAIYLLGSMTLGVWLILRVVNIRKEL